MTAKRLYCLAACDGGRGRKKRFQVSQRSLASEAARTRPDGANCRPTAHMNTPESAVGLVHSRQSARALRQSLAYNLNLRSSWQRQLPVRLYTRAAALPGSRHTLPTLCPVDGTFSSVTNRFAAFTRSVEGAETCNKSVVR